MSQSNLIIRQAFQHDLPALLALSTQARWNQNEQDWQRLLDLWPAGCIVGCVDEKVVGSAMLACYANQVAWIGMILVDEACRGQGFGGAMFDSIVQRGRELNIDVLGLDATDMGRPLYLKRGFGDICGIDRWTGICTAHVMNTTSATTMQMTQDLWSDVIELDRAATAVDRISLLKHLADEPGAVAHCVVRDNKAVGFGIARTGRNACHLGPVVATTDEDARQVLLSLMTSMQGREAMIDVPRNGAMTQVLSGLGFECRRKLTRMLAPVDRHATLLSDHVYAAAGFELG